MKIKLFLDMDGLLVNLFDCVSHKLYKKPYKKLTVKQKRVLRTYWVDKQKFEKTYGSVKEFFASLQPFGKNGELTNTIVNLAVKYFKEYYICTHPTALDPKGCKQGKTLWIKKHLHPRPKKVYFPKSKAQYASQKGSINILVDDFLPYISEWQKKGGYAINMRTDKFKSKQQLEKFFVNELKRAKKICCLSKTKE